MAANTPTNGTSWLRNLGMFLAVLVPIIGGVIYLHTVVDAAVRELKADIPPAEVRLRLANLEKDNERLQIQTIAMQRTLDKMEHELRQLNEKLKME